MTVLNSFLIWVACRKKMTHRLLTFPFAELDLNWDYHVSTSDGRFSELQNISTKRYVTKKIYSAEFPAVCNQGNAWRPAWWAVCSYFSETSIWSPRMVMLKQYTLTFKLCMFCILDAFCISSCLTVVFTICVHDIAREFLFDFVSAFWYAYD